MKKSLRVFFLILFFSLLWNLGIHIFIDSGKSVTPPTFLKNGSDQDPSIVKHESSAREAKYKKNFWMESSNGEGYSINVWKSPELFSSLFPGYPYELASEQHFISDYFSRVFQIDTFTETISQKFSAEFRIVQPWLGCLDIYKRQGADLIIIGTSETFRGISVDLLSRKLNLPEHEGRKNKILMCAGAALQIQSATWLLKKMKQLRPNESPIILYGQSYSVGFIEGARNKNNLRDKNEELEFYDFSSARAKSWALDLFDHYHEKSLADIFPKLTWNKVSPRTYAAITENKDVEELPLEAVKIEGKKSKGGFVFKSIISDPKKLEEDINRRMNAYYRAYDDFSNKKHCASSIRKKYLEELASAMSNVSSKVYLFLPPTTPLAENAAPICLREKVKEEVTEISAKFKFQLQTIGWKEYQLDYTDFVIPTLHPDVYRIDIQHANWFGAKKITENIANWINRIEASK